LAALLVVVGEAMVENSGYDLMLMMVSVVLKVIVIVLLLSVILGVQ
jgi:hypothetical protein